jgi:hypothetical protein
VAKTGQNRRFLGGLFFGLPPPQEAHLAAVSFPYIVVFPQELGFQKSKKVGTRMDVQMK